MSCVYQKLHIEMIAVPTLSRIQKFSALMGFFARNIFGFVLAVFLSSLFLESHTQILVSLRTFEVFQYAIAASLYIFILPKLFIWFVYLNRKDTTSFFEFYLTRRPWNIYPRKTPVARVSYSLYPETYQIISALPLIVTGLALLVALILPAFIK